MLLCENMHEMAEYYRVSVVMLILSMSTLNICSEITILKMYRYKISLCFILKGFTFTLVTL